MAAFVGLTETEFIQRRPNLPSWEEKRRHSRTRKQGARKLEITHNEGGGGSPRSCEATLFDFSEGGLGMDCPTPFPVGSEISIHAELEGSVYSVQLDARARVAYCRKTTQDKFRIGVGFVEVAYRRLETEALAATAS